MAQQYTREELVARLIRAGEIEVTGEDIENDRRLLRARVSVQRPRRLRRRLRRPLELLRRPPHSIRQQVNPARHHHRRRQQHRLSNQDRGDLRPRVHAITDRSPPAQRAQGRLGVAQHLRNG